MTTFTLDTNCFIAVDENRAEANAIRTLARAHAANVADVGILGMSASERQSSNTFLENFDQFRQRLERLGLGHLPLLKPMAYFDITFWDWCISPNDEMEALEQKIHEILFPSLEFSWIDFCAARGLDTEVDFPNKKWRNAKCDVQAFWSHAHHKREIFVSADTYFHATTKSAVSLN